MQGCDTIPSYNLYRHDRRSRGRGVLVYVPKRCRSKRRLDLEDMIRLSVFELNCG